MCLARVLQFRPIPFSQTMILKAALARLGGNVERFWEIGCIVATAFRLRQSDSELFTQLENKQMKWNSERKWNQIFRLAKTANYEWFAGVRGRCEWHSSDKPDAVAVILVLLNGDHRHDYETTAPCTENKSLKAIDKKLKGTTTKKTTTTTTRKKIAFLETDHPDGHQVTVIKSLGTSLAMTTIQ